MKSIVLCVSGNLGHICLKNMINESMMIAAVFTDSKSAEIINLSEEFKIPAFVGNPREKRGYHYLIENKIKTEILFSINYLFIIDEEMLSLPWKHAINFHGSLLPKYRGRTPHVWAIINGEKEVGVTAHEINKYCDEGDIILQHKIYLQKNDTGATVLKKYESVYPKMIKKICIQIDRNKIFKTPQDHSKATYFGKRTPEDGLISWDWFKERIFSWVQALSYPYPGAFTYYNGQKIIIDKIIFTNDAFTNDMPNGFIIKGGLTPVIKVPNGAIKIIKKRDQISFDKNKILLNDCLHEK